MNKKKVLVVGLLASVLTAFIVFAASIPMWTHVVTWDTRVYSLEVLDPWGIVRPSDSFENLTFGSDQQIICILHNNGTVSLNLTISENIANIGSAVCKFDKDNAVPHASPYSYPAWAIDWSPLMAASAVNVILPVGFYYAVALHIDVPNGELGSYSWAFINNT